MICDVPEDFEKRHTLLTLVKNTPKSGQYFFLLGMVFIILSRVRAVIEKSGSFLYFDNRSLTTLLSRGLPWLDLFRQGGEGVTEPSLSVQTYIKTPSPSTKVFIFVR